MQPSSSFEIDSPVKEYHAYLDDWKPCRGEVLQAIPEPNNAVDKYAVCVHCEKAQKTCFDELALGLPCIALPEPIERNSFNCVRLSSVSEVNRTQ